MSGPAQDHDPAQPPDGLLLRIFVTFPGPKQPESEAFVTFL